MTVIDFPCPFSCLGWFFSPHGRERKKEFNLGPGKQDAKGLICSGFHNFGEERRLAWLVKSLSRSLLETEILLAIGFLVSRNENDFLFDSDENGPDSAPLPFEYLNSLDRDYRACV